MTGRVRIIIIATTLGLAAAGDKTNRILGGKSLIFFRNLSAPKAQPVAPPTIHSPPFVGPVFPHAPVFHQAPPFHHAHLFHHSPVLHHGHPLLPFGIPYRFPIHPMPAIPLGHAVLPLPLASGGRGHFNGGSALGPGLVHGTVHSAGRTLGYGVDHGAGAGYVQNFEHGVAQGVVGHGAGQGLLHGSLGGRPATEGPTYIIQELRRPHPVYLGVKHYSQPGFSGRFVGGNLVGGGIGGGSSATAVAGHTKLVVLRAPESEQAPKPKKVVLFNGGGGLPQDVLKSLGSEILPPIVITSGPVVGTPHLSGVGKSYSGAQGTVEVKGSNVLW